MEERMQIDDGFNLIDLIKVLLNTLKLLILVVICGGLAGAGFAIWRTIDENYYGTTVEFYINPESKDATDGTEGVTVNGIYGNYNEKIMATAVYLLNSDDFAEWLILNGEALPAKEDNWMTKKEEETLLNGASWNDLIEDAQAILDEADAAEEAYNEKRAEASAALTLLQQEWKRYVAGTKYSNFAYTLENYEKIVLDPDNTIEPPTELVNAYHDYEGESGKKAVSLAAHAEARRMRAIADNARTEVLSIWEKTAKYKAASNKYSDAVSFSIPADNSSQSSGTIVIGSNSSTLNFIRVKISILNDEVFANELLAAVKKVVPNFIEATLSPPTGYTNINCQRITRNDEVTMTNPGYTKRQAIIYGMGGAAFAGLIACVIIIIADRSNKCLRNYEVIPKNFNVPILGVIPTIEEMLPANDKNAEVKQ